MPPRRRSSVPSPADDFIGRERELDRLATLLLGSARLITVLGPGGIGKTRLVAEAVHRFRRPGQAPVPWVRLARLPKDAGAAAVEDEVVRSVVDNDFSGRPPWQALVETIEDSPSPRPLLIIDNCEHVVTEAGKLISDLLEELPELVVLATSRGRIGWVDEQLLHVPPLSSAHAVELFRRRAELTGTRIEDKGITTVRSICGHVNNQPLHIRLAAARLYRQPLPAILQDLSGEPADRRLLWSDETQLGADERHRGINEVIAWSFDLCGEKERLLLERMSVFAPGHDSEQDNDDGYGVEVGADVDAVRAICSGPDATGAALDSGDIQRLLDRLTDQSLVSLHLSGDEARYSLLESIRVFAQQRSALRARGEVARLAARHRRYYRDRVVAANQAWFSHRERELLNWARASWDDLLLAIDGSLGTPSEAVVGLEIVVGMIALRVPFFRGSLRESRSWAEKTLDASRVADPQPVQMQLATTAAIAWICLCQGLPRDAERRIRECADICLEDAETRDAWLADPVPDRGVPAEAEFAAGCHLLLVRQDARASVVLERAREKFSALEQPGMAAMSELFEALAAAFLMPEREALDITRRHLDNAARSGGEWAKSWAEIAWIVAETKHGDLRAAVSAARSTLARQIAMRDSWGAVWTVHAYIWTLSYMVSSCPAGARPPAPADAAAVAKLLGGAEAMRRQLGVDIDNLRPFAVETDMAVGRIRKILGATKFDTLVQEGRLLRPPMVEVARLALADSPTPQRSAQPTVQHAAAKLWKQLSRAEQEVALLAAAGWTNTAIASRRGSSHRTVDTQVAAVLRKLMIGSRDEIGALVPPDQSSLIAREQENRSRARPS
ncbi:AAA family ATPase [Nocardia sp. NPDC052254]|uniref:ATP-binding protein n=1 Tax=Nocardia sp. NPDC052254 TaxID=3155681 RepID=UPI0034209200